jgi:MFS family permease
VTSWPQALAARVADRVGKGVRGAPRDALIADAVGVEARGLAFGLHRAMDHAGAVVGPLAAIALVYLVALDPASPTANEYRAVFLLAAIPAAIAVFIAAVFVRESRVARDASAGARAPRLSLRGFDASFKRFLLLVALFTLSNSADALVLLRASQLGVSTAAIPLLWAALHVAKVASSLLGGHLSDVLGRKRLIGAGWLLYGFVYAGFAFATAAWHVWLLFAVYGLYFGLAEGAEKALVADLVAPSQRGTAFGLYNLAFGITVLPAALLTGGLWELFGPTTAFLTSGILGASAAVLLPIVRVPEPAALVAENG